MAANLGAHETMELHELLAASVSDINTMRLYRPHIQDQRLAQIADKQLQFAIQSYNHCVQAVQQLAGAQQGMYAAPPAAPYGMPRNAAPVYGLDHPVPLSPDNRIDDRDVAFALLNLHKAGATMKIIAALECANPQLRANLQQGAVNCSEQAYEIWQYMNQAGYYQVPTMKEITTETTLNAYQPAAGLNPMGMGMTGGMSPSPMMNGGMHVPPMNGGMPQ
ncbi:Spore coat protein CotF [Paenibacillus sp. UNC496MF]|uniref:spore coat protein n=1 Tax=Paenibacillus sp. UNC496MF TaxID=1502753 RepID=UPI0008F04CE2|nr:spore coat protein [Paenibacillus sp. UNC496MF]SFI40760.1 Spore coat protein CotF [Paenibacillus sp. UNC496MF]